MTKPINSIPEKFERELEIMKESGEEPILDELIRRAGVNKQTFYYKINTKQVWAVDYQNKFIKLRNHWEKTGGANYKKCKVALKAIIKKGDLPNKYRVALDAGFYANFLRDNLHPWKEKLKKEIEVAAKTWENEGGKEAKKLRKALENIQNRGNEPSINAVCAKASYRSGNLHRPSYKWQEKIVNDIKIARTDYNNGIHNSVFKKYLTSLQEVAEAGEFPTEYEVSKKAGHSKRFVYTPSLGWKKKVIDAIEKARGDFEKLKVLFVDNEILIQKVANDESIEYKRLGILLKHSELDETVKFNLSHIMYEEHRRVVSAGIDDIYVIKKSYQKDRKVLVDGIVMASEGMNFKTRANLIPYMCKCAVMLGNNIPRSVEDAKQSLMDYSYYLERIVKSGENTMRHAYKRQRSMILLLSGMFGVDESEIVKDLSNLLFKDTKPKSNAYDNVADFSQEELGYAFAFYYHLFSQVADFLLEKKDFPCVIKLPNGNAVLPGFGNKLIIDSSTQGIKIIDRKDGHILSKVEIDELFMRSTERHDQYKARRRALKFLEEVNRDMSHLKRLQWGKKALDAWFMCMLYFTAMNDSTLGTLPWSSDDEFEIESEERREFVSIKPRAMYKEVRFSLPKQCIKDFEKFLKLRRYVLNGNDVPYLFFGGGWGDTARVTKYQFEGGLSGQIVKAMLAIDNELPRVTSKDSRRDSSRDALKDHGLEVALAVLQNNRDVLIKHYNGQTGEEMASDVSRMLENLHDSVMSDTPISSKEANAMGGCDIEGKNEPETFDEESPIKADCYDPKSCIFCLHYVTFPEPDYIRKLLSLQYLIENTAYDRAESEDFYEKEMKPWLTRINVILNKMIEKEPKAEQMKEKVTAEVYEEGLLSPYWLYWVDMFEDLGRFA